MSAIGSRPVRWGILGAGRVARSFAEGLGALPDARLVGVASRTPATLAAFQQVHPADTAYTSYAELVDDDDIDIVYIATPHHRHAQDALLCIEHGRAVLCEKPFTVNAEDAARVVAAARDKGVFCMEAMWTRSLPLVRHLRTLIADGAVGDVRMITCDFSYPAPFDPESRLFDRAQAGGALLDRGVYGISLASMLLGRPEHVSSHASIGPTGVDEQVVVTLQGAGALAQVTASLRTSGSNEAMIMGTEGTFRIHAPFYRPERMTFTRVDTPPPDAAGTEGTPSVGLKAKLREQARGNALARRMYGSLRPLLARRGTTVERIDGNGYNYEAAEAQRCLRAGLLESPDMPLDESVTVMETMDRARAAWTPGTAPPLD